MKTDALIDLLATGAGPAQRHTVAHRLVTATTVGAAGAVLLLLATFGISPQLSAYASEPSFWIKMSFAAALAIGGVSISGRLARPGVAVGGAKWFAALPILAMWLLATVVLITAAGSGARPSRARQHVESVPVQYRAAVAAAADRQHLGAARTRPNSISPCRRRRGPVGRRYRCVRVRAALLRVRTTISGNLVRDRYIHSVRNRLSDRAAVVALVASRFVVWGG